MPRDGMNPGSLATGSDGNLWFTESARSIATMTTSGTVTEYALPDGKGVPSHLTLGPDGNIWFTEAGNSTVGRITRDGTITEFPEGDSLSATATAITAGPDGDVWIAEAGVPAIAKVAPDGTVTRYPINVRLSGPNSLVAGTDDNVWFADPLQRTIGRITTSGTITEFPESLGPDLLARGPDAVYFLAPGGFVGRIAASGIITSVQPAVPTLEDSGIVAGTDGDLWITEQNAGKIARLQPDALGAHGAVSVSTANLSGTAGVALSGAPLGIVTTAETSPNPADYTATINWGDGSGTTTGTLAALASASDNHFAPGLAISGDHTYVTPGSYKIEITVTGNDHSTASGTSAPRRFPRGRSC